LTVPALSRQIQGMTEVPPPAALPGSVNLIAACDENRLIGSKGRLPWRIREDWLWFLANTSGGACVIGRLSYEAMLRGSSVNEKRRFFVVSRNAGLAGSFSEVFPDYPTALAAAKASGRPVWICGGERIYAESFASCDRLYLTRVHAKLEGDAWLPDWSAHFPGAPLWKRDGADGRFSYSFEVYERR
jgi:dihydrofolate reductase